MTSASKPFPYVLHNESTRARWDNEWLEYFRLTYAPAYFRRYSLDFPPGDPVAKRMVEAPGEGLFNCVIAPELNALSIHCTKEDIVGKKIVEIGCGPGYLAKQVGLVAEQYLGLDHSELALSVARLVAPDTCVFHNLSEQDQYVKYRGMMDAMIGRFFFIHLNYDSARWVMLLGTELLKSGGRIFADFYRANEAVEQGVVHPARATLDPNYPSCCFQWSDSDIASIAVELGLKVLSSTRSLTHQRQFVTFSKP